jgi:hypothetical protein
MAGYPNRIARSSLGPDVIDTWPVKDERKAIPARTYNLNWWQVAGSQLCVPRGVVGATVSGTTVTTDYQTLAWDPEGGLPLLVWTYDSVGDYSFDFPNTTYPDEAGNDVPLVIPFGMAQARELVGGNLVGGGVVMSGPKTGSVKLQDFASTDVDADFFMLLW